MFDLQKAIAEWRRQMINAGVKSPVPLDELEIHLREEIERQMASRQTEPEAFRAAIQLLGAAQPVQNEFAKIGDVPDAMDRKIQGVAFGLMGSVFPLWICTMVLHFWKSGSGADLTTSQQLSGILAVVLYAALVWAGRLGYSLFPVVRSRRARGIFITACAVPLIIWWGVFFCVIAQQIDFTISQLVVAILWAFVTPTGAMMGATWGMETAARKAELAIA